MPQLERIVTYEEIVFFKASVKFYFKSFKLLKLILKKYFTILSKTLFKFWPFQKLIDY